MLDFFSRLPEICILFGTIKYNIMMMADRIALWRLFGMNTPILFALLALLCGGITAFFAKVVGENQGYSPSYMIVQAISFVLFAVLSFTMFPPLAIRVECRKSLGSAYRAEVSYACVSKYLISMLFSLKML